ncbi:MAG: homocysteine S-methyltransferase family protein [Candidatus Marinimicrobia bacterium]|jgi:homocysteine S-methyltransferase|nr:homocysteine S-methyltransferase family protein [Candidatus Neomarinimicrobiota bacterium]
MASYKILDGAMGSELIKRGLTLPNHIWSADANIHHPKLVQKIHRQYVDAGADYIITNTFRTSPRAYQKTGLNRNKACQMAEKSLMRAVELAKNAATADTKILGSIAPLEDCYKPELFPGRDTALSEFSQLGRWLDEANVDILILETMNSIEETEAGICALKNVNLPLWVSFVLKDEGHLLSGDRLSDTLNMLNSFQVEMVLLNCSPLGRTKRAVDNIVDNWSDNWGIYPNLGRGEPSPDGCITEYEPMEKYLSVVECAFNRGASVVGGCCGSSYEHIAEIKKLIYNFAE